MKDQRQEQRPREGTDFLTHHNFTVKRMWTDRGNDVSSNSFNDFAPTDEKAISFDFFGVVNQFAVRSGKETKNGAELESEMLA